MSEFRYRAFISYAHADEQFVKDVHRRLERFRIPPRLRKSANGANRLGTFFRDRDELGSAPDLSEAIRGALAESEYLIVVCSPAARKSRWVNQEIEAFNSLRAADRILLLVAPDAPEDLNTSFPTKIIDSKQEHLAADARPFADGEQRALLKIVAGLMQVGFDDLQQRAKQASQRRYAAYASLIVVIALAISGLTWRAHQADLAAQQQHQQASQMVEFLVKDLNQRLEEYEDVGKLDEGLAQALNYFRDIPIAGMSFDTLKKYQDALIGVGRVRIRQGKLESALEAFQRAAQAGEFIWREQPDNAEAHYDFARNTFHMGEAYWEMQNIPEASRYIQRSNKSAQQAAELAPEEFAYQLEVIFGFNNLGAVLTRERRFADAVASLQGALNKISALKPRFPEREQELSVQEVESLSWMAELVPVMGDLIEAKQWHARELELREQLWELTNNIHHQARLADALSYQAKTLNALGDNEAARAALDRTLKIGERLMREDPDNVFWRSKYLINKIMISRNIFASGDAVQAQQILDETIVSIGALIEEGRNLPNMNMHMSNAELVKSRFLIDKSLPQAQTFVSNALARIEPELSKDHINHMALNYFCDAVGLQLAIQSKLQIPLDVELAERAIRILETHGNPEGSIFDATHRAVLMLAKDPERAELLHQELSTKDFNSNFYNFLRDSLI